MLLDYESPLLRAVTERRSTRLYACSAHFVWVGERTRRLDGAHIAFVSLLANPIGIKIGPSTTPGQVAECVERLDPDGEPGRLTLISRMGASGVRDVLGPVVERVARIGRRVVWLCGPVRGNTQQSADGYKTRRLESVVEEITGFVEVHRASGAHPGGLHLELTGDPVTECLGAVPGTGLALRQPVRDSVEQTWSSLGHINVTEGHTSGRLGARFISRPVCPERERGPSCSTPETYCDSR